MYPYLEKSITISVVTQQIMDPKDIENGPFMVLYGISSNNLHAKNENEIRAKPENSQVRIALDSDYDACIYTRYMHIFPEFYITMFMSRPLKLCLVE